MARFDPEHPVHLVASSATTDQAVSDPDVAEDAGGELPGRTHDERFHAGFLVAVGIARIAAIARTRRGRPGRAGIDLDHLAVAAFAALGATNHCFTRGASASSRSSATTVRAVTAINP